MGGEGGPYHMDSGQTYKIAGLFCGGKGGAGATLFLLFTSHHTALYRVEAERTHQRTRFDSSCPDNNPILRSNQW